MSVFGNVAKGAGGGTAVAGGAVKLGLIASTGVFAIAIVAVAAILGGFVSIKGKTRHLDWTEASNVSRKFAAAYFPAFWEKYGEEKADGFLARELAKRMVTYLEGHYQNAGSNSFQYWIGNAIQDLKDRIARPEPPTISAVVYVYGIFIGVNYDATRPKEWAEFFCYDLLLFWDSIDKTYPNLGLAEFIFPVINVTPQQKANQTYAEQLLGTEIDIDGISTKSPASKDTQVMPTQATTTSSMQLVLAFAALAGIIKYASGKK